eukprot:jgi/Tetstr1/461353/TSEL_006479.t1
MGLPSVPPHRQQGKVRGLLDLQLQEVRVAAPEGQALQAWVSWQPEGRARRVGPVPLTAEDGGGSATLQFAIRCFRDEFGEFCSATQRCVLVLETQSPEPVELASCALDLRQLDVVGLGGSERGKEVALRGPKGGGHVGQLRLSMSTRFGAEVEREMAARTPSPASAPRHATRRPDSGLAEAETPIARRSPRPSVKGDSAWQPMPALLAALVDHAEQARPELAAMFHGLDAERRGALDTSETQALLQQLLPTQAAPWQLEYLVALLDTDQDGAVTLQDATAGIEEWRAFVQLSRLTRVPDNEIPPDPLAIISAHLASEPLRPAGQQLLREAVAAGTLPLAGAVRLLRALLPRLTQPQDRQIMATTARFDTDGTGTLSTDALLTAIGFGLAEQRTPGAPTPTFVRAAQSEYAQFMRHALDSDPDESPQLPAGDVVGALRGQADRLISPRSGSSSSSICSGTPYFAVDGAELTPNGIISGAGGGAYSTVSNPLYPGDQALDGDGSACGASPLEMPPPSSRASTGEFRPPEWSPSSSASPLRLSTLMEQVAHPGAPAAGAQQLALELQAELLAVRAVSAAKEEVASMGARINGGCGGGEGAAWEALDAQLALARQERAGLLARVAAVGAEVDELRGQVVSRDAAVAESQAAAEASAREAAALAAELEELEREAAEWRAEETASTELQGKVAALEEENRQLKAAGAEAAEEAAFLSRKAEGLVGELQAAEAEAEELRAAVDAATERELALQEALDAAGPEGEEVTGREDGHRVTEEQAQQLAELARATEELAAQLAAAVDGHEAAAPATEHAGGVPGALAALGGALPALQLACRELLVSREEAEAQLRETRPGLGTPAHSRSAEELGRLEGELERLEADAASWEEDRAQMVAQLMGQSQQKSALEGRVRELEGQLRELEAVVAELEAAAEEGGGGGGLLAEELHAQHMDAQAAWEAERAELLAALRDAENEMAAAAGAAGAAAEVGSQAGLGAEGAPAAGGDALEAERAAWEEDRGQMVAQLMGLTQEKGKLEAELRSLQQHTEELEQLLEEMQAQGGADGGGGGGSTLLLQELHEEHMEERAEWEAERGALVAEVAELRAQAGRQVTARSSDAAATPAPPELAALAEEKRALEAQLRSAQERVGDLQAVVDSVRDGGDGGGVSSLLMEELHQQHMDELAQWEAEKAELTAELAEARAAGDRGGAAAFPHAAGSSEGPATGETEASVERLTAALASKADEAARLQAALEAGAKERDALRAELRAAAAGVAAAVAGDGAAAAVEAGVVDAMVADAVGGAREYRLEQQIRELQSANDALQLDLQVALTEQAELLKNPLWETDVPHDELKAELAEAQAMVESLLEEHGAMEGEIVAAHGERQAMDAKVEGLAKEKRALQSQLNMIMITMTDSENQVHMVTQEKERLEEELEEAEAERRRLEDELQLSYLSRTLPGEEPPAHAPLPPLPPPPAGEETRLQAEVAELSDRLIAMEGDHAVLVQQVTVKTGEKAQLEAEYKALQQHTEELEQLLEEMQAQQDAGGSPSGGGGGGSTLLLEELHQQHMDELAEWEAEKAKLASELEEARAWRAGRETAANGKPDEPQGWSELSPAAAAASQHCIAKAAEVARALRAALAVVAGAEANCDKADSAETGNISNGDGDGTPRLLDTGAASATTRELLEELERVLATGTVEPEGEDDDEGGAGESEEARNARLLLRRVALLERQHSEEEAQLADARVKLAAAEAAYTAAKAEAQELRRSQLELLERQYYEDFPPAWENQAQGKEEAYNLELESLRLMLAEARVEVAELKTERRYLIQQQQSGRPRQHSHAE